MSIIESVGSVNRLLALTVALGMCGCVSLKAHREAVEIAEMRGKLEGQDQVLSIANRCVELLRARNQGKLSDDETMDLAADEAAKQADKEAGPAPTYSPLKITPPHLRFDGCVK